MFVVNKGGHTHSVPDRWKDPEMVDPNGTVLVGSKVDEFGLRPATDAEIAAWREKYETAEAAVEAPAPGKEK